MKVLYLNLPYKFQISRASRWPEKTKSGTMYYPYWLCYSAGAVMEQGHEVRLIDCIAKEYSTEQTIFEAKKFSPDLIVAEITTPTCFEDYTVIEKIKAAIPSAKIAIGGTHITALPKIVMEECTAIDIALLQEYDFTVAEIASGLALSSVRGIAYRDSEGVKFTDNRPYLENLDALPFVSKVYEKFLNVNDYCYAFAQSPMIQVFSSRGCPCRCNFCSYPETVSGRLTRYRSVKNFVDELCYISANMPYIREIFIEDDTFTVNKKRVIEICDEILARNLKIVWSCNTRADLPLEVMQKMKEAGCRLLVVGYESGNQNVLNETKKGITLEQSRAFAKNAKKVKLKVFGCFMIGLKGDNLQTIKETYRFAKELYPDMCFFQQAVPFPGTAFYAWAKEEGYLRTEDYSQWLNKDGYLNCLVDYPYANHKEIEKIRDSLMSKYYFSFTYIFKTFLANLSWFEFKRVMKGGFTYILFRIKKSVKQ